MLLVGAAPLAAQPNRTTEAPGPPITVDLATATKWLADFRNSRLQGDFCVRFQIEHLPLQGGQTLYEGIAWGTWNEQGPLTRFELWKSGSSEKSEWLIQNGVSPKVWTLASGTKSTMAVPATEWTKPLLPGLVYTPFDLLVPFVYWPEFKYLGSERRQMGGVDVYQMQPPAGAGGQPVKIYLNREFNYLADYDQLDAAGKTTREFELGGVRKVQDQYLPSEIDLSDRIKRDHDSFTITAAALGLKRLDAAIFNPANLTEPAAIPPPSAWTGM